MEEDELALSELSINQLKCSDIILFFKDPENGGVTQVAKCE
jgi:hypothetical protein